MRVLITGATGFIGGRLCEQLSKSGHEIWGLTRDPEKARKRVPALSDAFAWNPVTQQPPGDSLKGVDAIVHLAGESVSGRWTAKKKQRIEDSRVIGTRNLVKALEKPGRPAVLVSGSAIGYYGDRGDEVLTEEARAGHDFLAKVCQAWENEAQRAGGLGMRVVTLRTGIVLGPDGGALEAMLPPFKIGAGGPLGSGEQWWSWIHRDDHVNIVRRAITDEGISGVYNATAPAPARQRAFAKVLGKVLNRPAFLPTPAPLLKIVLGGFSTELLSSKRVVPGRLQKAGFEFEHRDLEGALREALNG